MADERYEWLDLEAAERLLRGDKVDPVDDHERAAAERLAEALESARPAPLAGTAPLPGEEAAMAAFRAVSLPHGRRAAAGAAPAPVDLGDVRLVAPAGRARRARWSRSFRFGLAASVAGLAVGGVAVAAGTGMLPTPFDGPVPASSVSAAVSPGPEDTDGPDDGSDSTHTPDDGHSHGADPSAPPSGGPSSTPPATGTPDSGASDAPKTDGDGKKRAELRARYIEACLDLRAGKLDSAERRRLAAAPKSGQTVKAFCDRLLGEADGSGSDRDTSGSDGSGDSGGSSGDGDADKGDDTSGTGSGTGTRTGVGEGSGDRAAGADVSTPVPTVSFRPLSPSPGPVADGADEADGAGTDGANASDDGAARTLVTRSV
ncbi:hypothetical protein ACGFMM_12245 [Streptomyces sp. NPDC048604]|uniref:hypothetical protein n=1 Tax=Streptomyces sp. NPDC048604 TaxID=3365578 RepID=UPI003717EC66